MPLSRILLTASFVAVLGPLIAVFASPIGDPPPEKLKQQWLEEQRGERTSLPGVSCLPWFVFGGTGTGCLLAYAAFKAMALEHNLSEQKRERNREFERAETHALLLQQPVESQLLEVQEAAIVQRVF